MNNNSENLLKVDDENFFYFTLESQKIYVEDPWNSKTGKLQVSRAPGHEQYLAYEAKKISNGNFQLSILNMKNFSHSRLWIIDKLGKYQSQAQHAVDLIVLTEFLRNSKSIDIKRIILDEVAKDLHIIKVFNLPQLKSISSSTTEYLLLSSVYFKHRSDNKKAYSILKSALKRKPLSSLIPFTLNVITYVCMYYVPFNIALAEKYIEETLAEYGKTLETLLKVKKHLWHQKYGGKNNRVPMLCYDAILSLNKAISEDKPDYDLLKNKFYTDVIYLAEKGNILEAINKIEFYVDNNFKNVDVMPILKIYCDIVILSDLSEAKIQEFSLLDIKMSFFQFAIFILLLNKTGACKIALDIDFFSGVLKQYKVWSEQCSKPNALALLDNINELYNSYSRDDCHNLKRVASQDGIKLQHYSDIVCTLNTTRNTANKNIAILFSGFLRNYYYYKKILNSFENIKNYNIYIFFYLFENLGNMIINPAFPKTLSSYSHGGLYREVKKTPFINVKRFTHLFKPDSHLFIPRETDEIYLEKIGITHPQWLMVYNSFLLMENYAANNNLKFDFIARARADNYPNNCNFLNCLLNEEHINSDKNIFVMQRFSYGKYSLSDRFAFGTYDSMKTYCEIGQGKNFVNTEESDLWKKHICLKFDPIGGSHETHLGCWLELNGIKLSRRSYLDC